jgi:hypothetical protein
MVTPDVANGAYFYGLIDGEADGCDVAAGEPVKAVFTALTAR